MTIPQQDVRLTRRLPERRYLPELHGVRGLALLGVVLFHLFGAGRVSGGIDIFLAISGFLFTGMLLREAAASGGAVDLSKYFGSLVRRIFIPAALVAVSTLVLALVILPATQDRQLWAEARASLLYFENIELINSQLTYDAAGPETSPFQHFWSLSVQGQFYLIWPFVAMIAVLIAKRLNVAAASVMAVIAGVILIGSLGYAVSVGSHSQDEAYLMTATRAWQLAFGAHVALAGSKIRLPEKLRWPAGWLGVALIVSCGFVLDGAEMFPGPWALWPIAGLTLVFISAGPHGGNNDPRGRATHVLSNRVLGWIGDHAYGLYLWHWPLLIFYMEIMDLTAIDFQGALTVLAITVVLAMLMHRFIEKPLGRATKKANAEPRSRSNKLTVAAGIALLAGAGVGTTALAPPPSAPVDLDDVDASDYLGDDPDSNDSEVFFPAPENARDYMPEYTMRDCRQEGGNAPGTDEITVCEDENAPVNPSATVVLAGGSHAGHLEAAFKKLGEEHNWEVLVVVKSGCIFGREELPDQEMCGSWNENFIHWLDTRDIDLVVTPGTRLGRPEYIVNESPTWWSCISQTGTDLLLVRGTPRGTEPVSDCLASGGTSQECGLTKEHYAKTSPLETISLTENAVTADLTEQVCPQINNDDAENCDAVVGNLLVWYDTDHFTTPFSQSLAPALKEQMEDVLPELFR